MGFIIVKCVLEVMLLYLYRQFTMWVCGGNVERKQRVSCRQGRRPVCRRMLQFVYECDVWTFFRRV